MLQLWVNAPFWFHLVVVWSLASTLYGLVLGPWIARNNPMDETEFDGQDR